MFLSGQHNVATANHFFTVDLGQEWPREAEKSRFSVLIAETRSFSFRNINKRVAGSVALLKREVV